MVKRYGSSVINRTDGSRLWFPPDAVFEPHRGMDQDIDVELTGTQQLFSLGTRLEDIWGRVFRYVEFGGTIAAGSVAQAEVPDAVHDDLDLVSAAESGDETLEVASPETGTADIVENEYAQGWIFSELTDDGMAYPIAKNDALDISGTADMTVTLFIPVRTAIVANADLSLVKSKFKEVIIHPSPPTAAPVGVVSGQGAGDGDFGWVQTRGPVKALTEGTVVIGEPVVASSTTDGAVAPWVIADTSAVEVALLGRVINVGPTTEFSLIDLALE